MSSTNPGPAITSNPVPQSPVGNLQKVAVIQSISITPSGVSANVTATQSFAAAGLGLIAGDICEVMQKPGTLQAGLITQPTVVTANDTLPITFGNLTASSITPAAGNYLVRVTRLQPGESIAAGSGYMNSF